MQLQKLRLHLLRHDAAQARAIPSRGVTKTLISPQRTAGARDIWQKAERGSEGRMGTTFRGISRTGEQAALFRCFSQGYLPRKRLCAT